MTKEIYRLKRDGDGWGITDHSGSDWKYVNQTPMSLDDAQKLIDSLINPNTHDNSRDTLSREAK